MRDPPLAGDIGYRGDVRIQYRGIFSDFQHYVVAAGLRPTSIFQAANLDYKPVNNNIIGNTQKLVDPGRIHTEDKREWFLLNISCYLESVYEICFLGWAQWNSVINKEGGFLGEKLQRYQGEKRGAKWVKGGAKNKEL